MHVYQVTQSNQYASLFLISIGSTPFSVIIENLATFNKHKTVGRLVSCDYETDVSTSDLIAAGRGNSRWPFSPIYVNNYNLYVSFTSTALSKAISWMKNDNHKELFRY